MQRLLSLQALFYLFTYLRFLFIQNLHWLSPMTAIVLYCIVVGFRRVMFPDALQPEAYCTNLGL